MSSDKASAKLFFPHVEKMRVLIIEDSKIDQMILQEFLNRLGFFNIQLAQDGSQGKMMIYRAIDMKTPYDLVFLDWVMPKMDGLSLFKEMKKYEETAETKFFMTTGVTDEVQVKRALTTGVEDYIVKPYTLELLYKKLKDHLSSAGQVFE